MTLRNLDNLVRTGQLHAEPPDKQEFEGLVRSAMLRLNDSKNKSLSPDSQFDLAYNAAHALALAAMRWHGYRTDKRYLVFQCLVHTLNIDSGKARVVSKCHERRNLAEYEGHLDIEEQLLKELIEITDELAVLVSSLKAL